MASIAVLPVLIGLAVDYAIQFQARFEEAERRRRPTAAAAARRARGAPTIATAGGWPPRRASWCSAVAGADGARLRAAARGGIALAFALRADRRLRGAGAARAHGRARRGRLRAVGRALRAGLARRRRAASPATALARGARAAPARASRPRGAGAAAAQPGARARRRARARGRSAGSLDTQTQVVSDVRELVPAEPAGAAATCRRCRTTTGVAGEIDVMVAADDLTDPAVVELDARYQAAALCSATATRAGARLRRSAELCPALSLPDLFARPTPANQRAGRGAARRRAAVLLAGA